MNEHNQKRLDELNQRDRRPTGVMVQVSARCNLGCKMCGYVGKTPNTGFIDVALFQRILDECRAYEVSRIYMETAWGEPMLHPRIFELLELAQDFNVVLSTNITPLTRPRIERLASLHIETLQLSFCGFDKESYESVYVGGRFDQVVRNLRDVLEVFTVETPNTTLIVNGVALADDAVFVERTVAFLKSLGFRDGQMEIKLPNNFGGLYTGSPVDASGIHTFKKLQDRELELCSVLRDNPGVYIDGRVTACGCLDNASALIIGDIKCESLRDIRHGRPYEKLVNKFVSGDISDLPLCSACDVPYTESRMISYVSAEPPGAARQLDRMS